MLGDVATPFPRCHRDDLQRRTLRETDWPELEIPEDAKSWIRDLDTLAESQRQEKMGGDYLQAVQGTIRVRNQTHYSSIACSFPTNISYLFFAEFACCPHRGLVQASWEEEIRIGPPLPRVRSIGLWTEEAGQNRTGVRLRCRRAKGG